MPFNCDSGCHRGQRRIYGGRSLLRSALAVYITRAALSAVKCTKSDNVFKRLYDRIVSKRPHKVGVIAVAHKMLLIAHLLVKNGVKWKNKLLQTIQNSA